MDKKPRGRPKKIVDTDNDKYELSVSIGDLNFNVETDNIVESILEIKPLKVNQRVIFNLRKGNLSATKMLFPIKAKMIFAKKMTAEFFVKRLILSMK